MSDDKEPLSSVLGETGLNLAAELAAVVLLTNPRASKVQRAFAGLTLGRSLYGYARDRYRTRQARSKYTISISSRDELYLEVLSWMMDVLPEQDRKAINAKLVRSRDGSDVAYYYDGRTSHEIVVDGHKIEVVVEGGSEHGPASAKDRDSDDDAFGYSRKNLAEDKIVFIAPSRVARDATAERLREVAAKSSAHEPRMFVAERWGGWDAKSGHRPRKLETVVLPGDTRDRIIADLESFLQHEDDYIELGIPWHRGYLFHGPPGTGKTSFAGVLAAHFGLDTYFISLPSVENDEMLNNLMMRIQPRSVLVLEDVDVLHAMRERDDTGGGITMAGLLNVLDGMVTPHGLITVMTTNNIDVLDSALIRPGRADQTMEIGYLDDDQLRRLWDQFTGDTDAELPSVDGLSITPAEVVGIFKEYVAKPCDAYDAVVEYLREAAAKQ